MLKKIADGQHGYSMILMTHFTYEFPIVFLKKVINPSAEDDHGISAIMLWSFLCNAVKHWIVQDE